MFPKQAEYNLNGYLLLLAVFIAFFIIIRLLEIRRKDGRKFGYATTAFLSLFFVIVFQVMFESFMFRTFYIALFTSPPIVLLYVLATAWLILGLYIFTITIAWALYKFYIHHEITDFMFEVISFADEVKKYTGL